MEWFMIQSPVMQATLAGMFTWGVTAVGASAVIFFKEINKKVLNGMLGFAAGVMIAASFWSLLAPTIYMAEMDESNVVPVWLVPAIDFLLGALSLWLMDKVIPNLYI